MPLGFFQFLGPNFFVEFLSFDDWIWLRDTKNITTDICVAQYEYIKRTREWKSLQVGDRMGRRKFYIPPFDEINRRNEEPTTVNSIFSSPLTIPTIKR